MLFLSCILLSMGSIHAEDSVISDEIVGDSDIPEEDNEDAPIKTYTDLFNQIFEVRIKRFELFLL